MSRFQDGRFIGGVFQGALRPMPPPSIHPSASGLLPTPSMTVQIPTAKVTHRNAARGFSISGWNVDFHGGSCFPPPVPVPELSPGRPASRLPLPQPDQPEVLSPRQITPSPSLMVRVCSFTWFWGNLLGDRLDFISHHLLILPCYGRLPFHIHQPKHIRLWNDFNCTVKQFEILVWRLFKHLYKDTSFHTTSKPDILKCSWIWCF